MFSKSVINELLKKSNISGNINPKCISLIHSELDMLFNINSDIASPIKQTKQDSTEKKDDTKLSPQKVNIEQPQQKESIKYESNITSIPEKSYNSNKCYCRIWNTGLGTQCTRDKKIGDFCNNHSKKYEQGKLEFGIVTEDIPTVYTENTKGKKKGTKIKWKTSIKNTTSNSNDVSVAKDSVSPNEIDSKLMQDILQPLKYNKINCESKVNADDQDELDFGIVDNENDITLKSEYSKLGLDTLSLDDTEFEVDDELILNGVKYTQFKYDEDLIYILDEDDKKVAEWNGIDNNTIIWASIDDEINHKKLAKKDTD